MGKAVGGALRGLATFLYMIDFLISAAILGIYSYFLAKLHMHHLSFGNQWRAVEGLSGAATLYTIFAVLLTFILGGNSFFAFLGMSFDLIFMGAMIAIAVLVREAAQSCTGNAVTPLGNGNVGATGIAGTNIGVACTLNLVVLILASIGALMFLLSFLVQLVVNRHHANEKYRDHEANNQVDEVNGEKKKRGLFGRRAKTTREAYEVGTVDGGLVGADAGIRPSHDTALTGTTMGHTDAYNNGNANYEKYESYPPLPSVQPAGSNIVSSTTVTNDAYYDPYARPTTTGPTGFVGSTTDYVPAVKSTNY